MAMSAIAAHTDAPHVRAASTHHRTSGVSAHRGTAKLWLLPIPSGNSRFL